MLDQPGMGGRQILLVGRQLRRRVVTRARAVGADRLGRPRDHLDVLRGHLPRQQPQERPAADRRRPRDARAAPRPRRERPGCRADDRPVRAGHPAPRRLDHRLRHRPVQQAHDARGDRRARLPPDEGARDRGVGGGPPAADRFARRSALTDRGRRVVVRGSALAGRGPTDVEGLHRAAADAQRAAEERRGMPAVGFGGRGADAERSGGGVLDGTGHGGWSPDPGWSRGSGAGCADDLEGRRCATLGTSADAGNRPSTDVQPGHGAEPRAARARLRGMTITRRLAGLLAIAALVAACSSSGAASAAPSDPPAASAAPSASGGIIPGPDQPSATSRASRTSIRAPAARPSSPRSRASSTSTRSAWSRSPRPSTAGTWS